MGILKNICLRIAVNREQRLVIWNALQYSDYKYRQNGNIDRAVVTSTVIAQTEKRFGVSGKKYTKEEVNAMLNEVARRIKEDRKTELDDAYHAGRQDAIAEMLDNIRHGRGLVVGEIVEVEETPEERKESAQGEEASAPTAEEAPKEEQKQEQEQQ
jgi:hypothetical protein